jgi:hypothetical protein
MRTTLLRTLFRAALLAALSLSLAPSPACGWGAPHSTITRAAAAVLPDWQKQLLGAELKPLGDHHCLIPDLVFTDKESAPFATMTNYPGVRYLKLLHVPATPQENGEVLRYFVGRAAASFDEGKLGDAARYAGTLVHVLEDWGCPAHAVPNDNMFTLFKQFLPPPESYRHTLLHSPVESGTFAVDIGDYQPRLLGTSADEAAFNLLLRVQGATVQARGQVIPIIQALYSGNTNAANAAQQAAAVYDAKVVADALFTLCCLGRKRFDGAASLASADLSQRFPLEAPDLYMPQTSFFSKPYWGHATPDVILSEGQPVPLKLNVSEQGQTVTKTFTAGIGTGTRSALTYQIPSGVYERFTAQVGLHADLGKSGQVIFEVSGNGKTLAKLGPVMGAAPAQTVDVPLGSVTNLQLTVTSSGGDGTGNYAVWGEPKLHKRP